MARSTGKSLAGTAAAVAKKVIGRRGSSSSAEPTTATKSTAKKVRTTKATATKAVPATKTSAAKKTVPVKKKTSATKAPVKKAPAKKAPATAAAKKTVEKPSAKKTAPKHPVAKKSPPTKTTPVKRAPVAKNASTKNPVKVATAPAAKKGSSDTALLSSLVVKEGEEPWTKAELDEVLTELHGQHDKLAHVIEDAEAELAGLMKDAGDGAGHDQADMGATSFERDHELTVVNLERDMVAQIDKALARIDDGTYGVCESCNEPIGKMRLMAFPRATLCLPCKQREERR